MAIRLMKVRIKVAKSESTPSTPILAKIAVRAAKPADRRAQYNQTCEDDIGACSVCSLFLTELIRPFDLSRPCSSDNRRSRSWWLVLFGLYTCVCRNRFSGSRGGGDLPCCVFFRLLLGPRRSPSHPF